MQYAKNLLKVSRAATPNATVYAYYLNAITRFAIIHEVIVEDHINTSGKLTWWCLLWHFLRDGWADLSNRFVGFERLLDFS